MVVPDSLAAICVDDVVPRIKFDDDGHVVSADFYAMRLNHELVENMAKHVRINHLSFAFTSFSDGDCFHLRNLPNLAWLSLHKTLVAGPGIKYLLDLNGLIYLDLFGCPLTTNAYAILSECKSLQTLVLSRSPIADSDLPILGKMKQLRKLYVRYTNLTENALKSLDELLPLCTIKRFAKGAPSARGK